MEIPITFHSDEKGYFDRECPNENCLYVFKVSMIDWKEKVTDEAVHCPMCGYTDTSDKWWTQKQLNDIQKVVGNCATAIIQRELEKTFKNLETRTQRNKFIEITYQPERRLTFVNNPLGQSPDWEREVVCPKCEMRYSVIGTAFFCPCCGINTIDEAFEESLDSIAKMIESLRAMEVMFSQSFGIDKAATMVRELVEDCLGNIVSGFQKFAEVIFHKLCSTEVRPNDFQIVEKGSRLFCNVTGKGYDTWLTQDELVFLKIMFQRRHLMVHNGGMVDLQYLQKTNDSSYLVGQRLVIRECDILQLIEFIKRIAKGYKRIVIEMSNQA